MSSRPPTPPPGYHARGARPADGLAVMDLVAACAREDGTTPFTQAEMEADWATTGFDVLQDTRVVEGPGGRLVAYAALFSVQRPPVHPYLWGRVRPDSRGLGLGTYLVRWGLGRAGELAPLVPAGARMSVYSPSPVGYEPSESLLRAEGFRVCRHSLDMRIVLDEDLPPPRVPPGVTLDRYRHPEELEATAEAAREAFRDHRGSLDEEDEAAYRRRFREWHAEEPGFDPSLWFLARADGEIAGLLIGRNAEGVDASTGHVPTLAVRRPWRRRGIALALLRHVFAEFRRRGKRAAALSVDAESLTGAVRLYEKAGMFVHRRSATWEREIVCGRELGRMDPGGDPPAAEDPPRPPGR